jgi:hypothetical protein
MNAVLRERPVVHRLAGFMQCVKIPLAEMLGPCSEGGLYNLE